MIEHLKSKWIILMVEIKPGKLFDENETALLIKNI
jgi:hypothetical protein